MYIKLPDMTQAEIIEYFKPEAVAQREADITRHEKPDEIIQLEAEIDHLKELLAAKDHRAGTESQKESD